MFKISMTKSGNVKLVMSPDIAREVYMDLGEAPPGNEVPYALYEKLGEAAGVHQ